MRVGPWFGVIDIGWTVDAERKFFGVDDIPMIDVELLTMNITFYAFLHFDFLNNITI